MKDPKVVELVKQFKNEISQINKTWAKLQSEGMYIDVRTEGNVGESKLFKIQRMTQSVEYLKEDQ